MARKSARKTRATSRKTRRPARRKKPARRAVKRTVRKVRKRAKKPARRAVKRVVRRAKKPARRAVRRAKKPARRAVRRARKPARRAVRRPVKAAAPKKVSKTLIGTVEHYYTNIGVGVIELTGGLKQGDSISIEGATTKITQKIGSMQINHVSVKAAKAGDSIGLKVAGRIREGDKVFRA